MQTLSFNELERELAAAGAAPAVIVRIIQELKDHCADAESAASRLGVSSSEARRQALARLGSCQAIVEAVAAQPDLMDWKHRWPHSARCLESLIYCLAVPAAPFVYCAQHPAPIVRWSVSSSLAACITGCLLLAMQWLIA